MAVLERQELTIRKWPLYFVAAVFFVFLFILNNTGKIGEISSLALIIGLLIFIVIYFMLIRTKLIIDNDGITQQRFFGKLREIRWDQLQSAKFNWHFHGHGANISWDFVSVYGVTIRIQLSSYSRKQLKTIAEACIEKCTTLDLDKRILNMAEGKFPWYIF